MPGGRVHSWITDPRPQTYDRTFAEILIVRIFPVERPLLADFVAKVG
jgi:hypothetical protein